MAFRIFPYFTFQHAIDFLGTKTDEILAKPIFKLSFYIHIVSSWVVMFLGVLQFIPAIFKKNNVIHRRLGKIYVIFVLLLSAPSGLVLAFYANGGLSVKIAFCCQSLLWWFFTFIAWVKIRKKNIEEHTKFMLRSYSITLAAMSLRFLSFLMVYSFDTKPIETYLTVAWLSWVGNLVFIEILIMLQFSKYLLKQFKQ